MSRVPTENAVIALEAVDFKVSQPEEGPRRDLGLRPDGTWSRWWQVALAAGGLVLLFPVSFLIALATCE